MYEILHEMGYVYVLRSLADSRTYTGSTPNLVRRMAEHNEGKVVATRNRRPLELVYSEQFADLATARKREKYLKTHAGRKVLALVLANL